MSKEISEVPYSNEVEYSTFSRVLRNDKISASYKIYWLLSLLDEVSLEHREIPFRKLISKMVVYAWYPLLKFKLSFGLCDNLAKVVNYISDTYNLASNYAEHKLFDFIYTSEDKMLKELTLNVPYRFLSPFFEDKLKGHKKVRKMIEEFSREDTKCIYEIYKDEKNENYIRVKENWCNYFKYNYRIIQG